ncbi:MAG: aminoglycoside N(3)-acetyltransferase [Anaerofustis sp.]
MSESQVIHHSALPLTTASIAADLRTLGIRNGDILLVHSSLSSLGWVCGSAIAVIDALLESVGADGTLCMPAHSGENSEPSKWENPPVPPEWCETIRANMPAYRAAVTPTRGMGKIAELFRSYPGTLRSDHPQVSFTANGKQAEQITKTHPLNPQFGIDSPLGELYRLGGKILLLGVGYGNCTSFHLSETLWSEMPKMKSGACILKNGQPQWTEFEDFDYDSDDFDLIGAALESETEYTRIGRIGNAECRILPVKESVDFAEKWIAKNRSDSVK